MLKRVTGLFAALAAGLLWAITASAGTIVGSAHDFNNGTGGFTNDGWNTSGEICVVCHTPHTQESTMGPLWNRATYTPSGFTMYSNTPVDGTVSATPQGSTVLCLSCHDGTVAIDNFGGVTTGTIVLASGDDAFVNKDMSDDHPVSITYAPGTGANQDAELFATTADVTFGNNDTGTVADLLDNNRVECSSCHDVHNTQSATGEPYLLRIDNTGTQGSELCLSCHDK